MTNKTRLDETRFERNDSFYDHYDRHVAKNWPEYFMEQEDELFEPMSEDDYDDAADFLSKQKVTTSRANGPERFVGFVTKDGRILKYGKELDEIVVYVAKSPSNAKTITYYKMSHGRANRRYQKLLSRDYAREITPEDDKYNVSESIDGNSNLLEMPTSRGDAIDVCSSLGKLFIEHFHKIYSEGIEGKDFPHHCAEMQAWLDKCRAMRLKGSNRHLTQIEQIDWFFTACGAIDEENGFITEDDADTYNRFVILLAGNPISVKDAAERVLTGPVVSLRVV